MTDKEAVPTEKLDTKVKAPMVWRNFSRAEKLKG